MKRNYKNGYDDCMNGKKAAEGASRDYYNRYGDAYALMESQDVGNN